MNYTIIVKSSLCSPGAHTALQFVKALIRANHCIQTLFFYGDGTYHANSNNIPNQDELQLTAEWQKLLTDHNLSATVCIAAALKRGMLDDGEAERYEKQGAAVAPPFELGGLGQLVEATTLSERVVTFL